jgi:uncharacterized membrane protein HdeD (DUF308 family)
MTETQDTSRAQPSVGGEAPVSRAAHNWGWYLFRGLLALALGILALLFPFSAVTAFAFVFALFALVDGVALVVSGIAGATSHGERWWGLVLAGLVGIAVGVIYIFWPALSTISYALVLLVMIAAWAFMSGVGQISAAIRLRKEIEGEWLLAVSGVFSMLLAIAILVATAVVPGATILSIGWIIGFYALLAGVALIILAIRLRSRRGL